MSSSRTKERKKKKTDLEDTGDNGEVDGPPVRKPPREAEASSDSDSSSSSSRSATGSGSSSSSDDSDSDPDSSDKKHADKRRTIKKVKPREDVEEDSDSESDEEDEGNDEGGNVEEELEGGDLNNGEEAHAAQKHAAPSERDRGQVVESGHEKDTAGAPSRTPMETKKKGTSEAKRDVDERAKESKAEGRKVKDGKRGGKTDTTKRKISDENAMDVDEDGDAATANTKNKGAKTGGKDKKTGESKVPKPAAKKRPAASVEDATDDEETPPKAVKPKPAAKSAAKKRPAASVEDATDDEETPPKAVKPKPAAKPAAKRRPAPSVEEVTDDEVTPPKKTPKAKGKAKEAKSPKKAKREKTMAADKNANDMDAAEHQARIEENLKEAFLGMSKLNIGAPSSGQVKLTWGNVNNRPLNRTHVAGLKRSIRDGKQASRYPVYATIKRSWINLKSLSERGEAYSDLDVPQFTDEGLGESVSVLSGHHRQQALEALIAEYKANLDRSKIELANAQKQLKKSDGENEKLARQVKLMQKELDRLTALHEEMGLWAVEWYDDDILTDESRAHLSENADFPSMPADDQEKAHMLMWLVRSTAVQWARKMGHKQLPGPGDDIWETDIIKKAVTATQAKNGSINFLIKHRVQYELYSMALEYPYFCSSSNLSLDQLSQAMQTPGNRNLSSVRTLGTFWAWMIRQGLTQMNMIANARVFPDVEDADDDESIPLHNLLVLLNKEDTENLRISKAAWNSAVGAKKKRKNATDGQMKKAFNAQLEYSPSQYKTFEDEMKAIDDLFIPDVFSRDILEEVDSIYDDII